RWSSPFSTPTWPARRKSSAACLLTLPTSSTGRALALAPGPPPTPFSPRRRQSRPRLANACGHFTGERSEHVAFVSIAFVGRRIGRARHGGDPRGEARRRAGRRRL